RPACGFAGPRSASTSCFFSWSSPRSATRPIVCGVTTCAIPMAGARRWWCGCWPACSRSCSPRSTPRCSTRWAGKRSARCWSAFACWAPTASGCRSARQRLADAARGDVAEHEWLDSDGLGAGVLLRQRAECATRAMARLPLGSVEPSLAEALAQAAVLFDAGLAFEVHELLEPYWTCAHGDEREALQGLIQVAVGYQHLANGNLAGARSLL